MSLIRELSDICGAEHVLVDPQVTQSYTVDWSRRFGGPALAVVRPCTPQQVAEALSACVRHRAPVIPQGGNTSLVAGSVPAADEAAPVIISTRRLTHVEPVDQISGGLTVGAGVTLAEVQRIARDAGWEYGVDLAARDSATIGGTVATNAGGIHVISRGMTRMQVMGVQAALPREEPVIIDHLAGLLKDNTGYDLANAMTGSEGTLGIITSVRLRLHRPVGRTSLALIGSSSWTDALELLHSAVQTGVTLRAAELTDHTGMQLAMAVAGLPWPLERQHALVLLLEVVDGGDGSGFCADVLEGRDVVIAWEAPDQARLWRYRELQSEAFSSFSAREGLPPAHKLDISIPLEDLAECAAELRARMTAYPGVAAYGVFGHLGDGNIHVEVCGPPSDDEGVDAAVLSTVSKYAGSVSAEHGIGRIKARWLPLSRSTEEIALMHAIKAAWDPHDVMNPGVLFA